MTKDLTIKVDGWELVQPDGAAEPLIRDTELGRRAGKARPDHLRGIIRGLAEAKVPGFEEGALRTYRVRNPRGGVAGWSEGFDLNEYQSCYVVTELRTETARLIKAQVIGVYMAVRRGQLAAGPGAADLAALRAEVGEALALARRASANPERFNSPARVGDSTELSRILRSALKTLAANRGWSFDKAHGWLRAAFKVPSYQVIPLHLVDLAMTLIRCADERLMQAQPLGPVRLVTEHEARQVELFQAKPRKKGGAR
jgi:hypothetical protein